MSIEVDGFVAGCKPVPDKKGWHLFLIDAETDVPYQFMARSRAYRQGDKVKLALKEPAHTGLSITGECSWIYSLDFEKSLYLGDLLQSSAYGSLKYGTYKQMEKRFGEQELLKLIKKGDPKLSRIKGLTKSKINELQQIFNRDKVTLSNYRLLRDLGLSHLDAFKCREVWGDQMKDHLLKNSLMMVSLPINNARIQAIKAMQALQQISPHRAALWLDAEIAIKTHSQNGSTAINITQLLSDLGDKGEHYIQEVWRYIQQRSPQNHRVSVSVDGNQYYASATDESNEQAIVDAIQVRRTLKLPPIKQFGAMDKRLNAQQKKAVQGALRESISIITGGPGVGKTTVLKSIKDILVANGLSLEGIILAAPTGKAARRMQEAIEHSASTVHSLLKRKDRTTIENAHTVIVDEWGMGDTELTAKLLNAIPKDSRMIFVGDEDQLLSVGQGNILSDLIRSKKVATYRLEEVMRYSGTLAKNAHKIATDKMPRMSDQIVDDYCYIATKNDKETLQVVEQLYTQELAEHFNYTADDIQILTPQNKTLLGVESLNKVLNKKQSNSKAPYLNHYGTKFRAGDRVIQTVNDYQLQLQNGDVGVVKTVTPERGVLTVEFGDREVEMTKEQIASLKRADAITVHRSQGSEYLVVIIPLSKAHEKMWTKRLFYTGSTRAKEKLILVGNKDVLRTAIKNTKEASRLTGLEIKLQAIEDHQPIKVGRRKTQTQKFTVGD